MAENRGELELYNQWFVLADTDKDGVVSGGEAVKFFSKSGLPTNPTLFKVWQYVAGDRPSLNRREFYTAMKLVSLAQLNGGVLDDQAALRLVNGLAGPVPPPKLQGLAVPTGISVPAATGAGVGSPARAPPPARAQSPGAAAGAGFVPLAPEQVAAFSTAFAQLDANRNGVVQGVDCFGVFMRSGLPKDALKRIWDLVAGAAGHLSSHQFVQALYLIEHVKAGRALPEALPSGQFPPVAGTLDLGAMGGESRGSDIFRAGALGELPPRATYAAGAGGAAAAGPGVAMPAGPAPFPPERLAGLAPGERERLEAERRSFDAARAEAVAAEAARAAAADRARFFTDSLAALRLAGSGVARVLVEAQQRREMETAAAAAAEADYDAAYADFSRRHAAAAPAVAAAQAAAERRAALGARVEALRAAVAALEGAAEPGAAARAEEEGAALEREAAALTARAASLEAAAAAAEARRGALDARRAELRAAADAAAARLPGLQAEVAALTAAAEPEGARVVAALRELAPLYEALYRAARAALLPLPVEALAGLKREALPLAYDGLLAAGAAEWGGFDDEGFTIVSALPPDERLATLKLGPAASAAAAATEAAAVSGGATGAEETVSGPTDVSGADAAEDVHPLAGLASADAGQAPAPEAVAPLPKPASGASLQPASPAPSPRTDARAEAAAGDDPAVLASAIAEALDSVVDGAPSCTASLAGSAQGGGSLRAEDSARSEVDPRAEGSAAALPSPKSATPPQGPVAADEESGASAQAKSASPQQAAAAPAPEASTWTAF
uniref:Uncharacterized protein n=3 Tax=Auxenochlorella protothecoides TaxID=3075 RepID=A0A1D1ZRW5_AUXPR